MLNFIFDSGISFVKKRPKVSSFLSLALVAIGILFLCLSFLKYSCFPKTVYPSKIATDRFVTTINNSEIKIPLKNKINHIVLKQYSEKVKKLKMSIKTDVTYGILFILVALLNQNFVYAVRKFA